MSVYETNRSKYSLGELQPFGGQWVAFSLDGSRILANAETLPGLEERLIAAGEDPQRVALEHIQFDDTSLGEAEWS
jgi:hypothetical protein